MNHDPTGIPSADGEEPTATERRVAARLIARSRRLELTTTPVEMVVRRGSERQRRQRTATNLLAVVAVCGATIGAVQVLSRPGNPGTVTSAPSSASAPPGAADSPAQPPSSGFTPITIVEPNLVWNRVDPSSAEAIVSSGGPVSGTGPFLAWSTTAGQTDEATPTIWRSADGVAWDELGDVPGVSAYALAGFDGQFFAYGTAPAAADIGGAPIDVGVAVSDDDGDTWTTTSLPIDVSELEASAGVASVSVSPRGMSAGPQGVLVVASVQPSLDLQALLPADVLTSNYAMTPTGIQSFADAHCPSDDMALSTTATTTTMPTTTVMFPATTAVTEGTSPPAVQCATSDGVLPIVDDFTWAELGVDADVARTSMWPNFHYFLSVDGMSFEEVAAPVLSAGMAASDIRLTLLDDRFVAWIGSGEVNGTTETNELYESADGRTWTKIGPTPIRYPDSLGTLNGQLVITGYSDATGAGIASVRHTDGEWTTVDLNDLTSPADGVKPSFQLWSGASFGATGITAIGTLVRDPVAEFGPVEMTRDGVTMRATDDTGTFQFVDAQTNTEIAETTDWTSTDPLVELTATGTFSVSRVDGGPVIAMFTSDEINAMMAPAYAASETVVPELYVLHSTDGVSWSRQRVADIAGEPNLASATARQSGSQVIVSATVESTDPAAPVGTYDQVILVGTSLT